MVALSAQIFAEGAEGDLEDGQVVTIKNGATASGASPTVLIGQLGAIPILDANGAVPPAGFIPASAIVQATYLGGSLYLQNPIAKVATVIPTVDGLTTGLIPAAADFITFTSANSAHIAALPVGVIGKSYKGWSGATAWKLRTAAASNETINNVDSDGTGQATIPANVMVLLDCVAAATWILRTRTNLGAEGAAIVPA